MQVLSQTEDSVPSLLCSSYLGLLSWLYSLFYLATPSMFSFSLREGASALASPSLLLSCLPMLIPPKFFISDIIFIPTVQSGIFPTEYARLPGLLCRWTRGLPYPRLSQLLTLPFFCVDQVMLWPGSAPTPAHLVLSLFSLLASHTPSMGHVRWFENT